MLRLIHLIFAIFCGSSQAVEYWVSPSGDDSNEGSIDRSWQTIGYSLSKVKHGDVIHVRGGIYSETLKITQSGKPNQPISLQAYQDEVPILDGRGIEVKGRTSMVLFEGCESFYSERLRNPQSQVFSKKQESSGDFCRRSIWPY